MFEYRALVDELRCHTTDWLAQRRESLVREQRRLHLEELAVLRVLDERGRVDDSLASTDGVSVRDVRDTVATARALEDLPTIAAVAAEGRLSDDQLTEVVKVAGPGNDREWAAQAPAWSPRDLAAHARTLRKPTVEDAAARRAARGLRLWWRQDQGMLDGRFSLPDIDGALFETVVHDLVEKMRPAKGQPWESRERRGADALMELVRSHAGRRADDTASSPGVHLVVQVPLTGPATVAGVPLPDQMVERLRAEARVEPVLTGDDGEAVALGRVESALSEKTKRVVKQRDGGCRWPGCDRRIGLEVHHLWPRSWGGPDHIANLATVCAVHHARLAPQGDLLLLGNPHHPGGLALVDRADLPKLAPLAGGPARAGPAAA